MNLYKAMVMVAEAEEARGQGYEAKVRDLAETQHSAKTRHQKHNEREV